MVAAGPYWASDSADGRLDAGGRFDEQPPQHVGRQAVGDDPHAALAVGPHELLELPLVDDEVVLALDPLHELVQRAVLVDYALEVGAADRLRSCRRPG